MNLTVNVTSQSLKVLKVPAPLPVTSASFFGCQVQRCDSIPLNSIKLYIEEAGSSLETVYLHSLKSPEVVDVIRALSKVQPLRRLGLFHLDLHGAVANSVAALTQLTSLRMGGCIAGDHHIRQIVSSLVGLKDLELHLEGFTALGEGGVTGAVVPVPGADQGRVLPVPHLTSLTIWGPSCSSFSAALPLLTRFPELRALKLYGLDSTAGLKEHVSALTKLETLYLATFPDSDLLEGLMPLGQLRSLRLLCGEWPGSDAFEQQLPVIGLQFSKLQQLRLLELPLGPMDDGPRKFCTKVCGGFKAF